MFAGFAGRGAKNLALIPTCLWRSDWISRMQVARSHRGILSLKDTHRFVQMDRAAKSVMTPCSKSSWSRNFQFEQQSLLLIKSLGRLGHFVLTPITCFAFWKLRHGWTMFFRCFVFSKDLRSTRIFDSAFRLSGPGIDVCERILGLRDI
jgi:hypothetical protein